MCPFACRQALSASDRLLVRSKQLENDMATRPVDRRELVGLAGLYNYVALSFLGVVRSVH